MDPSRQMFAAGRAAWPDLAVPEEVFLEHLARMGAPSGEAHASELYLCCACGLRQDRAIAAFERQYAGAIRGALGALALPPSVRDDLAQLVLTRLFVASAEARPKILEYSGKGDLGAWVRVLATRVGLRHLRDARRRPQSEPDDEGLLDKAAPGPDAELKALEERFGAQVKTAFVEALKALPPKDQNILRQRFLDDLTWEQLASLNRVHRATVIRWLAAARHALFEGTQRLLMERTGMARSECASLIRVVQPDVSITLRRILR